jgi:hypothetical protein
MKPKFGKIPHLRVGRRTHVCLNEISVEVFDIVDEIFSEQGMITFQAVTNGVDKSLLKFASQGP